MAALIDGEVFPDAADAGVLADAVVPVMARACSLIDLNAGSNTYGCADRQYWYYRTLTNFPGATWQQLMLACAALYRAPHPANPWHASAAIADLAGALLGWWAKAQHRDGAFDEWYLNEHSYCATAITSAGAALTLHLLGDELSSAARDVGARALEQACRWLEPRYNPHVMNQNLAAAVALQGFAKLLPQARWQRTSDTKLMRVLSDQNAEGWFPEYGGMDFGYSTLALDLLAALHMLGAGELVADAATRLCRFLVTACGAGSSLPGRLGSRGTIHAFPFGALYFAAHDRCAASLARRWTDAIATRLIPTPVTVDDRYFAYFYQPQFALAFMQAVTTPMATTGVDQGPPACSDHPQSGLVVLRRRGWSATISRRLGGVIAIEIPDCLPLYHLGYEVTTESGVRYSSAVWQSDDAVPPFVPGHPLTLRAAFRGVSSGVPLRRWMVPFQVVVYGLRWGRLAEVFQATIKRRMIVSKRGLPLKLERRIDVTADGVSIRDTLIPEAGLGRITALQFAPAISMHSPSARQSEPPATIRSVVPFEGARMLLADGRPATLVWTWVPGARSPSLALSEGGAQA